MNPYAIIGAIIVIIAAFFAGDRHGHTEGKAEVQALWNADKIKRDADTITAINTAVAKNKTAHDLDIQQSQKVIANYETTIDTKNAIIADQRRTFNAVGLRFDADKRTVCGDGAGSGKAASAVNPDGSGEAVSIELPKAIADGLRDLAEDADKEVVRLSTKVTALQDWAITHGFYGPVKGSP